MKLKMIAIGIFSSIVVLTGAYAQHFWRGETISQTEVAKKWGKEKFDAGKFKSGDLSTKAKMAASLIGQNSFKGKSPQDVRSALGAPSGYYFSDIYMAYIINEPTKTDKSIWQIVFLVDSQRKISDVIVHKNCCDGGK